MEKCLIDYSNHCSPDTGEITYFNFHGYSQAFGIMTFGEAKHIKQAAIPIFFHSLSCLCLLTAYMCHHNSFLLYSALEGASQQRWDRVTHLSVFSSFLAMLAFAVGGYVTFLEQTQGDLLNNYCWSDDLMNVCRLLFAATIMLTYPIECFVCREVMENILFQRMGLLSGGGKGEESDKWKNSLLFSHVAITIGVVALCFAISLSTDCLGLVLVLNVRIVVDNLWIVVSPPPRTFAGPLLRRPSRLRAAWGLLPEAELGQRGGRLLWRLEPPRRRLPRRLWHLCHHPRNSHASHHGEAVL